MRARNPNPNRNHPSLRQIAEHVLLDGFRIVIDLDKSHGSYLFDAAHDRQLIDLYGFFGSNPVGFNHPHFDKPEVKADMLRAAKIKIANSDIYSEGYARFLDTFWRVVGLPPLERMLLIEGGALAIENTLKAAMDWKVRKNLAAGRGERGTEILHFRRAFHGRSGYTMSLTNTDPGKTDLFAKFNWPRVSTPFIDFSLGEPERTRDVIEREKKSEAEIMQFVKERGLDIAAIIIEPIQGEGGDNHFRGEWLQTLRRICDENEMLLIFDEVQCGMCVTGRNWCSEHFGVLPDLMAFGKKAQVCGVMAGPRLDEVKDNCFPCAESDQLDLGRQFYRHGALDSFPSDHRGGESGRERGRRRRAFSQPFARIAKGRSDHNRGPRPGSVPRLRSARSRRRAISFGKACSRAVRSP